MDFKIKEFKSFTMSSWDNLLTELEGPLHNCNWNNLNYYSSYNKIENISFVIFYESYILPQNEKLPYAVKRVDLLIRKRS